MKKNSNQELICGINLIKEVISVRPKSIVKLIIKASKNKRKESIRNIAKDLKINIEYAKEDFFLKNFSDSRHQGIAALCNAKGEEKEVFLESITNKANILILVLDHLTDPHNVGACIRSAKAAGADAVIVPKNRSCHLTPTVRKVSSGASELLPFVIVTNLSRTLNHLKEKGLNIIGADMEAKINFTNCKLGSKTAIVIGSEDKGLKRLTRENCSDLVSISMPGKFDSLNASVSAGILLFEYLRQNTNPN
tara:strand:- start:7122 stop:7871 length:750 start_codon:yes stop_codon:yes gene_type:complete